LATIDPIERARYAETMSNPLRSLKFLPWLELLQIAALTTLIAKVVDLVVAYGFINSQALSRLFDLFLRLSINANILWALVACFFLTLWLAGLVPPSLFVNLSETSFIAVLLGIFWQGRCYWRW
jgi:CBS domain containing-hemolysin-like protein